jgi:hypothetical protein
MVAAQQIDQKPAFLGPSLITGTTGFVLLVNPPFGSLDHCIGAPLQELAERAKHVVLLARLRDIGPFRADDERHRVHAETGHAELDPESVPPGARC